MSNKPIIVILSVLVIISSCNNHPPQGLPERGDSQESNEVTAIEYDYTGKELLLKIDDMIVVNNSERDGTDEESLVDNNKPFTMVVYIGDDQCTTCRLKAFHVWDDFIELMNSDSINYYFIVKPKEDDDIRVLKRAINQTYFSRSVFLDVNGGFISDNSFLVPVTSPYACLTDKNGTVLYVGDPFCGYETMSSIIFSQSCTGNDR